MSGVTMSLIGVHTFLFIHLAMGRVGAGTVGAGAPSPPILRGAHGGCPPGGRCHVHLPVPLARQPSLCGNVCPARMRPLNGLILGCEPWYLPGSAPFCLRIAILT